MDTAQMDALTALHNRATRYEIVADNGDRRIHIGFTARRSKHGILKFLQVRGQYWLDLLQIGPDDKTFSRGSGFTMGPWLIHFSGRTQRESILAQVAS